MMTTNTTVKKNMFQSILHYGALLGLFWMFKYLFKIGEEYWEHFIYFYSVLQIGTPLLMYFFYMKYLQYSQKKSTIWKCILFCVGIGFCASIFEDAMIYAHYGFINSSVLYDMIGQINGVLNMDLMQQLFPTKSLTEVEDIRQSMLDIYTPKFVLVVLLFSNSFAQTLLSLIFGLVIGIFLPSNIKNKNV